MVNPIKSENAKKLLRDSRGRFLRIQTVEKDIEGFTKAELFDAIKIVEKRRRTPFLEKFVEMAYKYPQVMIAIARKFVPDISISELKNASTMPFNVFITQYLTKKTPKEEKDLNKKP